LKTPIAIGVKKTPAYVSMNLNAISFVFYIGNGTLGTSGVGP